MCDLIIESSKFQHTKIHKGTWIIPATNDVNQIDHVLVNRRRMQTVTDVRSMRGPDCDSDHFLVRTRCNNKIMNMYERYSIIKE
jgi:endonuclease/exonuclease/phosphatase family metal-dependent hydrolase